MRLFKILVKHYAPKDSHEAVEGFLLRESEEEVLDHVMMTLSYLDDNNLAEVREIYDDDYENSENITRRAHLMRTHGQIENDHEEVSDLFYGATQYGWEDMGEATEAEVLIVKRLGLLIEADA